VVAFTFAVIGAYYAANMVYTARSTLIECSKMCVDMMVVFMQNLGVMNQISIPWPDGLVRLFEFASLFVLNLQSLGFSCVANNDLKQYLSCVIFFWTFPIMLPLFYCVTQVHREASFSPCSPR